MRKLTDRGTGGKGCWLSHLGEVKSTGLSTGSTPGGHTDGAAGSDKGAVDLPGPQTGAQAPDMLSRGGSVRINLSFALTSSGRS